MFVAFTEELAKAPIAALTSNAFKSLHQQKIEEKSFYELVKLIETDEADAIIQKHRAELERIPLVRWPGFFNEKQQAVKLADTSKISEFLNKLQMRYGVLLHLMRTCLLVMLRS